MWTSPLRVPAEISLSFMKETFPRSPSDFGFFLSGAGWVCAMVVGSVSGRGGVCETASGGEGSVGVAAVSCAMLVALVDSIAVCVAGFVDGLVVIFAWRCFAVAPLTVPSGSVLWMTT